MKETTDKNPPSIYRKKMKKVLSSFVSIPLPPDIHLNTEAENQFNALLPFRPKYTPDGPEWAQFHDYWTGKSWLQYWDIAEEFKTPDG